MNGPQDLGGRDGFGPVALESDELHFHAPWERRAFGVTLAAGTMGAWTLDETRFAREDCNPVYYYTAGYYGLWINALETLLIKKQLVTRQELATGTAESGPVPKVKRVLKAGDAAAVFARGNPVDRDPGGLRPKFAPDEMVRTKNLNPRGHTRLPNYARDKVGHIEAVRGYHVYADSSASGDHETAHWLYTVRFDAQTLWGDRAEPSVSLSIDAWEPYLTNV
ncbi:nitrile hydratase subunit beta [Pseudotabrizicola sp. 4114]|uniref:nitrile hydratase subunit beta n=1 Tax=Pseudotabrizicola sp. 4114 TaxID=2817731 RepID=UPI00285C82C4|nr:nitrile hydratase [Pseudorhodobacter sp. 4114]